jgi:hypothetical protein
MKTATAIQTKSRFQSNPNKSMEFRLILGVSFALSLIWVSVLRGVTAPWRFSAQKQTSHKSIFEEARSLAQTCASFAFMG